MPLKGSSARRRCPDCDESVPIGANGARHRGSQRCEAARQKLLNAIETLRSRVTSLRQMESSGLNGHVGLSREEAETLLKALDMKWRR